MKPLQCIILVKRYSNVQSVAGKIELIEKTGGSLNDVRFIRHPIPLNPASALLARTRNQRKYSSIVLFDIVFVLKTVHIFPRSTPPVDAVTGQPVTL
ncbi:hypothetical protein Pcinc_021944 [Petrolisthes cinctipes]|uniref:Uncharacterized protein n=1 Tax=Petrolisthes cinctipes TaxID=88211 RepID=A0AAE1FIW1_PETCI|nr:hypothetical protein Pcinc_021944 [Petrolisthes cinctipes]